MELDDETLAFAQSLFELAREGGTEQLADYLDHGLSPDLTNSKGDSLLLLGHTTSTRPRSRSCSARARRWTR